MTLPIPRPPLETERLQALRTYDLLDGATGHAVRELAHLAAEICAGPWASITFVDEQRTRFNAQIGVGLPPDDMPRDVSFCGHAILQADLFIVPDAVLDERFVDTPLVAASPGVRFYAGAPLITPEGHALGTLCVFDRVPRDLSAAQRSALRVLGRQVMAQLELRRQTRQRAQSEDRLTLATDAASIGVWDWDLKADQWYASPVYCSMLGYPPDKGASDRAVWLQRLHPEDRAAVSAKIQAAIANHGVSYEYEARMQHADGRYRWIHVVGRVLAVDEGGQATRLVGVRMDVTERKLAELRVQHLNRVYAVLSRINEIIVREKDRHAMLEAACRIAVEKGQFRLAWIGLVSDGEEEMRVMAHCAAAGDGKDGDGDGADLILGAMRGGGRQVCNDIAVDSRTAGWRDVAAKNGYRAMASLPLTTKGKEVGTFNLYAGEVGFFDADELWLLDELAIDISFALEVHDAEVERHRMELALRESEDRFRQLAENIQEVFWMTDPARRQFLYISPAYEKLWGRSCTSLYEMPDQWLGAVHHGDRPRIAEAIVTKQTRGDYDERYRIVLPDGTVRWIHDRAYPVRDSTGQVLRLVGTAEDITEARQLEEQLRQSQRMEAIGQLAGGVAHDFNNILAAIMMQADLAISLVDGTRGAHDLLTDIKAATERAANLTRQLLAFSRRQVMQPRMVNLNDVVTSLTKMLARIVGEDVVLQVTLHPQPLLTRADAGMLDQVLLNLVVNARDAMPSGGRLTIETSERLLTLEHGSALPDASPGRYLCVSVADTGTGIEQQHLARIFEPFYTTKDPSKGTGLGLATAFGIVKQHGGWLVVDSEVGRGSTFEVLLRPGNGGQAALPEAPARPAERGGSETILVVEDDAAVRRLTRRILERAGYRVLEAADGVEALRVWEQDQNAIDLLMTDIVMPEGISGRELAERLYARNPKLRVILTSGYSADIAGQELSLREGHDFLQKPASPRHLLDCVRRCLDV